MMKALQVFNFREYRVFVREWIEGKPNGGHGEKSKISAALKCHSAYFSQILSGKAELSTEQAFALCEYFGFSIEETDYFLLLVHYSRAGSENLRQYFLKQIITVEKKRSVLENRLTFKKSLAAEDQAIYFSVWYHAVIHLMIGTMKGFQTIEQLEKVLALPSKIIRESIQFLERNGLIIKKSGNYEMGAVDLHLEEHSAMFITNHTHWRMQAIRALERHQEDELHYSSVVTINAEDFASVKKNLVEAVLRTREVVSASKNENAVCALTLDWFKVL